MTRVPHRTPSAARHDAGPLPDAWLITTQVELPDGPAAVARLPGVPEPHDGHAALFDAARRQPLGAVFVAGPGSAATALWAARGGARVVHWTESAAEGRAVTATFEANGLPAPKSSVSPDFTPLKSAACGAALVHLPRGRDRQRELLRAAAAVLREGGKLVVVGARREGVKSAVKEAKRIFGQAGVVSHKGGYHAAMAYRPPGEFELPAVPFRRYNVVVDGEPTKLVSCPGVFAPDRLDVGAAALIRKMDIAPASLTLDLGSGTGLAGLAAARRGARTISADVSARAAAATRRTLDANGFVDAEVYLCCGAAAVPDAEVDTVITNPPFHSGHDVDFEASQLFVREAARVLKAGGEVYLVANAFLDYGPWLKQSFRAVEVAWQDRKFRVWRGRR
jgi:16S rRNA (guanine1207-N2)-methyltransferase